MLRSGDECLGSIHAIEKKYRHASSEEEKGLGCVHELVEEVLFTERVLIFRG